MLLDEIQCAAELSESSGARNPRIGLEILLRPRRMADVLSSFHRPSKVQMACLKELVPCLENLTGVVVCGSRSLSIYVRFAGPHPPNRSARDLLPDRRLVIDRRDVAGICPLEAWPSRPSFRAAP